MLRPIVRGITSTLRRFLPFLSKQISSNQEFHIQPFQPPSNLKVQNFETFHPKTITRFYFRHYPSRDHPLYQDDPNDDHKWKQGPYRKNKKKHKKQKRLSRYLLGFFKQIFLVILVMFVTVKVYHKFRLFDPRKKLNSKPLTRAVQFFESSFRFTYCMGFMLYSLGKYSALKRYYLKIRKYDDLEYSERMDKFHEKTANKMLNMFLSLGGIFIKFGQETSMLPILPEIYHEILSVLHDKVTPIPWEDIESLVYEELGENIHEIFDEIDKKPVAAASLAQVYKWKLRETNEYVAVKVQYPLALHYIDGDIFTQQVMMKVGSWFEKSMKETYEGFKDQFDLFRMELDFLHEAQNQKRCLEMFKNETYTTAPKVVDKYTSARVITMEYIENGVKPTDLEGIRELGYAPKQVAREVFKAFAKMIFEHGFVHGDLHSGNMFVTKNETRPGKPTIVILDHGLYSTFPEKFRREYARFWKAMILGDTKYLEKYCSGMGITNYKHYVMLNTFQSFDGVLKDDMMLEGEGGKFKFPKEWEEDLKNMKKGSKVYEEWEQTMTNLPPEIMFVLRSSFILGFINSKLGAPVNRFSLMARVAQTQCFEQNTWVLTRWYEMMKFELNLGFMQVKTTFITFLLRMYMWWKGGGGKEEEDGKNTQFSLKDIEKRLEML